MLTILAAGQAGPAGLVTSAIPAVIVAILLALLLVGLIVKVVAGSILGHAVGYGGAVLAFFVATLVQATAGLALYEFGLVDPQLVLNAERNPGSVDPLMPLGPTPFILTTTALALGLAAAIRFIIRGPNREAPSWTNAALVAIAVTTLMVALQYGLGRGVAQT